MKFNGELTKGCVNVLSKGTRNAILIYIFSELDEEGNIIKPLPENQMKNFLSRTGYYQGLSKLKELKVLEPCTKVQEVSTKVQEPCTDKEVVIEETKVQEPCTISEEVIDWSEYF